MPPPDPTPQEATAQDAAERERATRARRLAWRVDVVLCALVSLPVISVLAGSGDAFLITSFFLPVGVMLVCAAENNAVGGGPEVISPRPPR